MWDPPPVLFLQSDAPPLRIFFAYLAYHAPTETYPIDARLRALHPTDHVFLFLTWHRLGFDEERLRQYCRFPCQMCGEVILCANTPGEQQELQAAGVRSIYFNHNAVLDERTFTIADAAGNFDCRPYRLMVNAAYEPYKRLHLAAGVQDAAWIGYWQPDASAPAAPPFGTWLNLGHGSSNGSAQGPANSSDGGSMSGNGCTAAASRYRYLQPAQVAAALNCSMLGGMFSAEEGTCWASTEYLLCGLPVISTPCCGGREVWYNDRNSLIVKPSQDAVEEAVERGIALLNSGAFDRRQIREGALQLMRGFRATLIGELQCICRQHGVVVDVEQHFTRAFVHKMGLR